MTTQSDGVFSNQLEAWLKDNRSKTLASLIKVFDDKSFAIIFLLLMILPALPIPTGGITHIFEIITMLLALEMIIGFKTVWLPKRWKHMKLGKTIEGKVIPLLLRRIRWFEQRSSPRGQQLFILPLAQRFLAVLILAFTVVAFVSPPFSGLDTLPSLAVVIISLSIILDDVLLLFAGTAVGVVGTALVIGLGAVIVEGVNGLF
jgi:hypothetical protein